MVVWQCHEVRFHRSIKHLAVGLARPPDRFPIVLELEVWQKNGLTKMRPASMGEGFGQPGFSFRRFKDKRVRKSSFDCLNLGQTIGRVNPKSCFGNRIFCNGFA